MVKVPSKKIIFGIVLLALSFGLSTRITRYQKASTPAPSPTIESPLEKTFHYPHVGSVPNIFGWRYNRSVCTLDNPDEAILFFYAEDVKLHFTYSSDLTADDVVPLPHALNPDFEVYCAPDGLIYIGYSDSNQQSLYLSTAKVVGHTLKILSTELVYEGRGAYTAIAPSVRVVGSTAHVGFMEYGRPGSIYPDSKAFISTREKAGWKTQEIIKQDASVTQVLGIALEEFEGSLTGIAAPYPGQIFQTIFNKEANIWSAPIPVEGLQAAGQLEWQTLYDSMGETHVLLSHQNGALTYYNLSHPEEGAKSVDSSTSTHGFVLFEAKNEGVFVLHDNRLFSVKDLQSPKIVTEIPKKTPIYFLQTAAQVKDKVHVWWVDKHKQSLIHHAVFDVSKYY